MEINMEKAIFAAGCFWGVELNFSKIEGVVETLVGYIAGNTSNPTYEEVCSGRSGHAEAIEISYDPEVVSYEQLLDNLWKIHNPTTLNQQGPDVGTQYRSAIFYLNEEQKLAAEKSKAEINNSKKFNKPVVTEVCLASEFWPAEEYHQQYLKKRNITISCG